MEDDEFDWVIRGGSWSSAARRERVAFRDWYAPAFRNYTLGLRLFCLSSDLELLARPTRELSNETGLCVVK